MITGIVASFFVMWPAAILLGWDGASICYLAWTWKIVGGLNAEGTRRHAHIEDASRRTAEGIVLAAGVALLAAVGLVLVKAGQSHGGTKAYLITIGIVSVMLSWATIHTVFMLRYTRTHYQSPKGAVDFNETDPPTYLDFAYLAFTIGMTFQVSDTNLTTKPIRRIALSHALIVLSLRRGDRGDGHQHRGEPAELTVFLSRPAGVHVPSTRLPSMRSEPEARYGAIASSPEWATSRASGSR